MVEYAPQASVQYVTVPAARGTITRTATAIGIVNPVLTIIVGAYDSGVIQNLYCVYNTQVRASQVCAKIDPRPYAATLDQYNGQLLRASRRVERDNGGWLRSLGIERYEAVCPATTRSTTRSCRA